MRMFPGRAATGRYARPTMPPLRWNTILKYFILSLPLFYLLLFFFYPILSIFHISFFPDGSLSLEGVRALWTRPYLRDILAFTVWQATLSTLLTFLLGLPAAYVFARFTFPGKTILRALLTVPFVLPTVVVATAFLALLGPRGTLNSLAMGWTGSTSPLFDLRDSLAIILLAHVFYNVAVVIRLVGGFWSTLDPRIEEAAAMLGASPLRVLREITFPLLLPAIAAAAILIFLFTFSSFGVILILGGLRYATIEVEIYRQAVSFFNLPLAASLSLLQILFSLLLMWLYTALQARAAVPLELRPRRAIQRAPRGWKEHGGLLAALTPPTVLAVAPLAALVQRSLRWEGQWSLRYYTLLAEGGGRSIFDIAPPLAIRNSLGIALATTMLSVLLGTLSAYLLVPADRAPRSWWRALLDPLFLLPLGTSAVTLGFGFIVALDQPPLDLRTSVLLVPLAHSLVAFPFVLRSVLPALRSMPPALREAAAVMGAPPLRRLLEVDLPILTRPLLVGALFSFAISMGEFGATSLIQRPEWPTMPLLIFRFLGQPGLDSYGKALAMSVLLMGVTAVGFMLIERFRVGESGEL